ncbi:hypothetical protein [Priestia aryabhattai]|uniref:hypothetical protein n=1 Tax=Priestia aryabhattai TaxID=412384 RepID=UPI003CED87DD
MKSYKLATVLLSASLTLSACGSDTEKEEAKNDAEETTSAVASTQIHKKDTSGESKGTKTTKKLPDKEQQALDSALLMFTHAKNGNFNAFKNDMKLHSKFSLETTQSEPADSEYKDIMANFAALNYADFNLKIIDWDKLSDATQIEIGEDYGGDSVLVSVTSNDNTLSQEDREGMDLVLIMGKYDNQYMMKEFKIADIIQEDINEQMYAGNSTVVKNTESEDSNNSNESTEEKSAEKETQNPTSEQQKAIDAVKKSFKDAEDQNLPAFKEDMSHYDQMPSEQVEGAMNIFGPVGYTDNYTFRIIDLEDFPETSEFRDSLLNEYGNQFVPISVTNNKDTLSEKTLKEVGSLEGEQKILKKIGADSLIIVENYNGEYKIRAIIPAAFKDTELAKLMYAHDPDTWSKVEKAIAEAEKSSQ